MNLNAVWIVCLCCAPAIAEIPQSERNLLDQLTGAKGTYTPAEDVHRHTFPRTDVKVTIEGRPIDPFLGLTSWAAFTPDNNNQLFVMGDLVLFEDEVSPVMATALNNGLRVTALHNHFFYESPRVMFMHIGGQGTAQELGAAVKKCLDQVAMIRKATPQPANKFQGPIAPETSSIPAPAIDKILGITGQVNKGMYKAVFGRKAVMHSRQIGNQMGVNTWAAFAGSEQSAIVDGDFATTAAELQAVLKALSQANIHVVAIHNHMTHENPPYIFLHYWGKGNALELAKAIGSALNVITTNI